MKRVVIGYLCLSLLLLLAVVAVSQQRKQSYVPQNGYVPNESTAIRIAEAVWIPIYGEKQIQGEKPFHATLRGGVWTVEGSLPAGMVGGVAIAEISQRDGRIILVSHGK
jgi:hypothetical protein